jgi:dienelactone hydrolase
MTTAFPSIRRFILCTTVLVFSQAAFAAGPRVLPEGKLPDDSRLAPPKDLDGYFPFTPPKSKAAWEKRAERVRRQILVSQGLWPMPTREPLNAVIHGRIDRGEYTVEKVYFESAPGFFVTGNLYRPKKISGKAPAVLFAHGHWKDARLSEAGDAEIFGEIATGQERFEAGGRSRFQSMCVQLARMGCVVWQWDMMSDSDAVQFSREVVHGFSKQRPEMNSANRWGLYSPQAEAHLQSIMGLQTWNAVRSLDFLLSLPEVDESRIAITGASGGGTQTMLLAAIDPRVTLSFPAVMVSTAMQGGCTCENASLLRVGTGNVEFAGLFAPKPQGMTTANDWTKEMSTKGFPELKQLYALLGAPNNVMLQRGEHFPHNYNAVSRMAFYGWLNKHFKLGAKEPVLEKDYQRLSRVELSVWDAAHPAPNANDTDIERKLCQMWKEDADNQVVEAAKSVVAFKAIVGGGLDIVLDGGLADSGDVSWEMVDKTDKGGWLLMTGLLRNTTYREAVPAVFCYPKDWNGKTVIWLSGEGKGALFAADGSLQAEVQKIVDSGATVLGLDMLYQGEFLKAGETFTKTPKVKNPREAAAYTFGYNHSVFVQRTHDVLSAVKYITTHERPTKVITVVGVDGAGPVVAAARAMCGEKMQRTFIDTAGFRFGNVTDIHAPEFLPGGAKYGDLPGMLALAAPAETLVAGESADSAALAVTQYQAAGAGMKLKFAEAKEPGAVRAAAVKFALDE